MQTFHIPINFNLNQRGSREGHKPLHLSLSPGFLVHAFFCTQPLIHDIIYKNISMRSMGELRWDTLCT